MAFAPFDDDRDPDPDPWHRGYASNRSAGHRMEFGEWIGLGVISMLKDREDPEPDIARPELEELLDRNGFELREADADSEPDDLEDTGAWIRIADPVECLP